MPFESANKGEPLSCSASAVCLICRARKARVASAVSAAILSILPRCARTAGENELWIALNGLFPETAASFRAEFS